MYVIEYKNKVDLVPAFIYHVTYKELDSFLSGLLAMGYKIVNIYLEVE